MLTGCAINDSSSFVHSKNWPSLGKASKGRQLVVFMDGTGNDVGSRTNVRRLYEMTTARHQPDVLTYYDPGVGTGRNWINIGMGGALGFGFQRNLRQAMTFLAQNYQEGDEISIFGFSRGAYSAVVLATLVTRAGLPAVQPRNGESYKQMEQRVESLITSHYNEIEDAEKAAAKAANGVANHRGELSPQKRAELWRQAYWAKINTCEGWTQKAGRIHPKISVLGVWDPVDSLVGGVLPAAKVLWSVSDVSEYGRLRGHRFHPYALGPEIKNCLIAFSMDEQRQPFLAELPDLALGKPEKYEFVWFPGDHSDLGGGHDGDKDLAGISMNWMLSHVGERLLGDKGREIKVHEDYTSPRHDLSVSKLYRGKAFRVRGEVLGDKADKIEPGTVKPWWAPKNAKEVVPARYQGWTMKIHHSVLDRMRLGYDLFYIPDRELDKPDQPAQVINLTEMKNGYDAPQATPGRNPGGTYCPRPFRNVPAVRASPQGWVDHQWSEAEIRSQYEIVP